MYTLAAMQTSLLNLLQEPRPLPKYCREAREVSGLPAQQHPLFPHVFSNHCSQTAPTDLSEKVTRHHLLPHSKECHPLLSLSHGCSLVHLVPMKLVEGSLGAEPLYRQSSVQTVHKLSLALSKGL